MHRDKSHVTLHPAPKHFRLALLHLFLVVLVVLFNARGYARDTKDVVVVIDVSTSMLDLFDEVKAEAKEFVSSAELGDRVTIITFGASSHLLDRTRIRSSYDMARLLSEIERIEPTEFSTNLPLGLEHGLREMQQYYETESNSQRIFLWLSDDKDNPPKDMPNLITFTSLKQQEASRLPDHSWFAFQSPIKAGEESDVRWFIDWASRSSMKLQATLLTDDLGTVLAPDLRRGVSVRFEPSTPAIRGASFSVVAEIVNKDSGATSSTIPVAPARVICQGKPWEETFLISFPNRTGNYSCRISFVLPSEKILSISPPQVSFDAKVQPEIMTVLRKNAAIDSTLAAAYGESVGEFHSAEKAFASQARASLRKESKSSAAQVTLSFGPISPRGQYQVQTALLPTRNVPLDSLGMKSDFELPSGLELLPHFRISEGVLVAELNLNSADNVALKNGWELKGTVSFNSTEDGVEIYPASIPVRFFSNEGLARWGRRELPVAATYEWVGKFSRVLKSYVPYVVKSVLIILAVWPLFYVVKRYGFTGTQLIGTLEVVKNPGDRRTKPFNLRRIGKLRARDSLTIGSSKKADIVLPHPSVSDVHARITTARTRAGVMVFIQPLHYNQIVVNETAYTRRKEIGDKDIVSIGDFVLIYRCPEVYRETIVRFKDGQSLRGVIVSWDIDSPSFEFLPKGAPSLDERMVVEFSELKAVFFVRKATRLAGDYLLDFTRRPTGRPVEVVFKDGEMIEGYMIGEASDWSKRFYLIPREQGEIALVLVERFAVQTIYMREAFEQPPFSLRRMIRSLGGSARV